MGNLTSIFKHTIIYSSGSLASSAVGFLLLPLYTSYLSPVDYGVLELLNISAMLLMSLVNVGVSSGLLRLIRLEHKDDPEAQKEAFSTAFFYSLMAAGGALLILILLAADLNALLFPDQDYIWLIRLSMLRGCLGVISFIPQGLWEARLRSGLMTTSELGRLGLNAGLNIYLVAFAGMGLAGVVWGNLLTTGAYLGFLILATFNQLKAVFRIGMIKNMLAYGAPLMLSGLLTMVITYSDRYFLQLLSGSGQVGLYALGFKIAMLLEVIYLQAFNMVWPNFYLPLSQEKEGSRDIARYANYAFLGAAIVAVMIIAFCRPVIEIMAQPSFWPAYIVCPALALALLIKFGTILVFMGFYIQKRTSRIAIFTASAALVNLILNYLFIPRWGALGAALASACAYLFLVLTSYHNAQKIFYIPFELKKLSIIALAVIAATAFAIFSDPADLIRQILYGVGVCIGFGLIIIGCRVLNSKDLARIKSLAASQLERLKHA